MPLWVSPDGSALLSPDSGALVLGDQIWANAGCKACPTPQKVDEKSQEQTAKQPGNFWTLKAMIGLKPFPSCPNKSPVGPGYFMKSQRRLSVEAEKEWAPGFIRSDNRAPGGNTPGR